MSCLIQPSLVIPVGSAWRGLCPWLSSRLAVRELEVQRAQLPENPLPPQPVFLWGWREGPAVSLCPLGGIGLGAVNFPPGPAEGWL